MTLHIPFLEIVSLVKEKTGRDITLMVVDARTIRLCYEIKVNIPLLGQKSKNVNMDITVEKVEGNDIFIQYSTNIIGGDMIIAQILSSSFLHKYKALYTQVDSTIVLHLNEVPQIKEVLEKIDIHSISFDEKSVLVNFSMRL